MNFTSSSKEEKSELQLSISCPIETKVLQIIRTFITSIANEMGFSDEDAAKIEIAVDEACANVVCHAYKSLKERKNNKAVKQNNNIHTNKSNKKYEIQMDIVIGKDSLKIEILDYGIGAKEGITQGVHELEEYLSRDKKHGLGIYIINKFMDEVEFDLQAETGTKVSMKKYLNASQLSP